MAYVSQELKKKLAVKVKEVLKKYGLKGTLSVRTYSTLKLKIKSGEIDFIENFNRVAGEYAKRRSYMNWQPATTNISVNEYWLDEQFDGVALKAMKALKAAMMDGNWNNSDIMTDYFDVGWYIDINIGEYDKPYEYNPA